MNCKYYKNEGCNYPNDVERPCVFSYYGKDYLAPHRCKYYEPRNQYVIVSVSNNVRAMYESSQASMSIADDNILKLYGNVIKLFPEPRVVVDITFDTEQDALDYILTNKLINVSVICVS